MRDPTIEDADLETYREWKQDLQKSGMTPEDIVAFAWMNGAEDYSNKLEQFIEKMEAACSEP